MFDSLSLYSVQFDIFPAFASRFFVYVTILEIIFIVIFHFTNMYHILKQLFQKDIETIRNVHCTMYFFHVYNITYKFKIDHRIYYLSIIDE